MPIMLDDMRAEFARFLTEDPAARFRMDAALAHVITTAYEHGLDDGKAAESERADYAWRNTNTIEKARQEEMAKRDALQADVSALKATIVGLLEILRQWEPDSASGEDRRTIVLAMYQVGILTEPTKIDEAMT
jgi:hypothetical protein